ncbi:MAG: hypothetical protein P9F19_02910 [Candidatus Contendobacter sp.]|nr:hypothetical protein [Candidatus Contendobacter sp.]MDG4556334.1 hypothetical protein [Candidatus Contendobacter sp.]
MKTVHFIRFAVYIAFSVILLKYDIAIADGDVVMELEEPASGSTYSGVSNVRGWAVAPKPIQRIELYIDRVFKTNIPIGGIRTDVGAAYPAYPDSMQSGFSMAMNYSELGAGQHTMTIRAIDNYGGAHDVGVNFNVTRFDNPFMRDPAEVGLYSASVSKENSTIVIKGIVADGKSYDIRLNWKPAIQGFVISQITPQSGGGVSSSVPGLGVSAEWKGVVFTPRSLVNETVSYQGAQFCWLNIEIQNKTQKCMGVNPIYRLYDHAFDHYGGYTTVSHPIIMVPPGLWNASARVDRVPNCNGIYRVELDDLLVTEFPVKDIPCSFSD